MTQKKVCVRVPASSANLGPGFDTIGIALEMYLWVEMEPAEKTEINFVGDRLQGLPTDKTNLIFQVAQQIFQVAGVEIPELKISVCSEIPLTRGLGSSASAIVAGMVAANALLGEKALPKLEIFRLATALEDHPDNVGPSIFGGIIVAAWDGSEVHHIQLNVPSDLKVLAVVPHFQLATEVARNILPIQYSRKDAVYNISHASLLATALATGDLDKLKYAMRDRLHEPYRERIIPGLYPVKFDATDHGALGVALSGAGPTILAFADRNSGRKQELENYIINTFRNHSIGADAIWMSPDTRGVVFVKALQDHTEVVNDTLR